MAGKVTRDHHSLRRNLKLNGNYISNDGGDEGLSVSDAGAVSTSGALTVGGDLTVSGTTTTLNTQTIEVEDNILQLNTTQASPDTATAATSGISVYRGNGVTQASLIFDDADDTWDLTNNIAVAGNIDLEGDIDVNGTANLDVVDIDSNVDVTAADGVRDNAWVGQFTNSEATDGRSYGVKITAGSTSGDTSFQVVDHDGSNNHFIVKGDGNVGIGTTSPQYSGNSNHTTLSILNSDTTDDADRPAVLELAGNNKGNGVRVGEINFWQDVDGGDDLIVSIIGAQEGTTSNNVGGKLRLQTKADGGSLTDRLVILESGNVGIGTDSPEYTLHTKGAAEIQALFENPSTSSSQFAYVDIESNASSSGEAILRFKTPDGTSYINSKGSATTMTFSSGNVGIGTTAPVQKLDIDGGASAVQIQLKETSSAYHRVGLKKDGSKFHIGEASNDGTSSFTEILTIDMNGDKVGIGTASPSQLLEVEKDQNAQTLIAVDNNTAGTAAIAGFQCDADAASGRLRAYSSSYTTSNYNIQDSVQLAAFNASGGLTMITDAGDINFWTGSTPAKRMTIDSSGDVTFANDVTMSQSGQAIFHINSSGDAAEVRLTSNQGAWSIFSNNVRDEFIIHDGTTRMAIDSNSRISLSNNDSNTGNTVFGKTAFNDSSNDASDYNTAIGELAMGTGTISAATQNTVVGYKALTDITQGDANTMMGYLAGENITTGAYNTFIGSVSGDALTQGDDNIAIGVAAMGNASTTDGIDKNVFIGNYSGDAIGSNAVEGVTAIGYASASGALESGANGTVAVGREALKALTSGASNTAIGQNASKLLTTGSDNTVVGAGAFDAAADDESNNVAIGNAAMGACDQGSNGGANIDDNVAIGKDALFGGDFGSSSSNLTDNVVIGYQAMDGTGSTGGNNNVFVGATAGGGSWTGTESNWNVGIGHSVMTGAMDDCDNNTAVGTSACAALTTGDKNVGIGASALLELTTGSENIAIGYHAFGDADAGEGGNVVIGNEAGNAIDNSGADYNVIIGLSAGTGGDAAMAECVVIGKEAMNSTGNNAHTGVVAIGSNALTSLTSGVRNIAIGYDAGNEVTDGSNNVFIGYQAGTENNNFSTGDYCTMVGNFADASGADGQNQTVIGYDATGQADNSVTLGNADVTAIYCAQDSGATVYCGGIQVGSPAETPALGIQSDVNDIVQHMDNGATTGNVYIAKYKFTGKNPDDNTSYFLSCEDAGTDRLKIWSDGDVNNADNAYGSISDKRIKQGIRDANSQWDDIKAVKVRNFKKNEDVDQYGDNAWEQIGVIAQELEASGMDKLIKEHPASENEARTGDGSFKEGDMIKSVSYSVLYMKAIKALQEAMAKIETLESKVAALEGK